MGACHRNATRHFLGAITDVCSVVMTTQEVECWGLKRTLEWFDTLKHYNVILEKDCKPVVDDVNKNKLNLFEYDVILQECKTLFSYHNKFVFARRQANDSTHALARVALSSASRNVFDSIPHYIVTIIINEMPFCLSKRKYLPPPDQTKRQRNHEFEV